jgi:hypothetical protein
MWRLRHSRSTSDEHAVVAEAVRLLGGRAIDADLDGKYMAVWLPVNQLAHADAARLRDITGDWRYAHPASWTAMLAYLAGQVLVAAPTSAELLRLQREALVPLELQLLDDPAGRPTTPGQLASVVMGVLQSHRIHRDR